MTRSLALLIILNISLPAQEPLRQATEGRFGLKIAAGQAPLRDCQVSIGSATPAPWEKDPAVRERHTDVLFPIVWWDWREITISFTPVEDGSVELVLNGPWEQAKAKTVFRQEILWDDISATGTTLANGL